MRIWLHEGHDGEPGVEAWAPDWLGFATWAEDRAQLAVKLPAKLDEYRQWCERQGVALAIRLLAATRADLLALLDARPAELLDWDPPYRRFAPWASWRTIRATLAHIADAETHYYLCNLGCEPESPPVDTSRDWRAKLALELPYGREDWSVRKSLRRLVAHERQHTKSIARIASAFAARTRGTTR